LTLISKGKLGEAWRDMGRRAEAERLLAEAAADFARTTGERSLYTVAAQNALALLYVDSDRLAEARVMLEKVILIYEAELGAEHETTKKVRDNLMRLRKAMENR
jgi:hypothetical protein